MKVLMDKFFFLIKSYIKMYKAYPGAIFIRLSGLPIQMLMYILLWTYVGKNNIFDVKYMITYYLVTGVLSMAYPYHYIAVDMEKEVMEGVFANYLVRPCNYMIPKLTKFIAWISIYSLIYIPVTVFTVFYNHCMWKNIICFLIFSFAGMIIEFLTWYVIGLLALFFERIKGMIKILLAIRVIISGALIPLSYMPQSFRLISDYMPFQCYIYVPTQMLINTGFMEHSLKYAIVYVFWAIMLFILSKILWSVGCTKVQSNMA